LRRIINPDEFWEIWDQIITENREGTVIITEGKHDLNVLRKLLIKGVIITSRTQNFWETIERILKWSKRVIILTDFDEEGEKEAEKLTHVLRQLGIEVLDSVRRGLKRALKSIRRIEELDKYVHFLMENKPFKYVEEEFVRKGIILHNVP